MSNQVNLGGDRLGSGSKMKVDLKTYNRSTHDIGYTWRSTMASGTLVPFMAIVGLPGDSFDIDLNASGYTKPTVGPLFGSYKMQLDVFQVPFRLYQKEITMNKLKIGKNMQRIKIPQMEIKGARGKKQINSSSWLNYLDIRAVDNGLQAGIETREFESASTIAYLDIYKNYYANKQEEIGYIISAKDVAAKTTTPYQWGGVGTMDIEKYPLKSIVDAALQLSGTGNKISTVENGLMRPLKEYRDNMVIGLYNDVTKQWKWEELTEENSYVSTQPAGTDDEIEIWLKPEFEKGYENWYILSIGSNLVSPPEYQGISLQKFNLEEIDEIREQILEHTGLFPYKLNENSAGLEVKKLMFDNKIVSGELFTPYQKTQGGLLIKTYQSDINNNWLSTEWIAGSNGINEITAIQVDGAGKFTIDALILNRKVYDMLNHIAVADGSFDGWLKAVYDHERINEATTPIYVGGLSKEIEFDEVVSNSQTIDQPLGTLAGRGIIGQKHKGGSIKIKVDEHSLIMGIISITPRIDYSQGNNWARNLKTWDNFHKPPMDEIGFQDLLTDTMCADATEVNTGLPVWKSAGKQPAWLNYMTATNQVYGNFADESEMFMCLNRRYEVEEIGSGLGTSKIKDLTTYIDPMKFNHIFADTNLDAQNFWVQIRIDNIARRKMSARIMPNL